MAKTMTKMVKAFRERQRIYQSDPVTFAKEVVQFDCDVWQGDTLRDLADPTCRRVSVRSGQGVGKTGVEMEALTGVSVALLTVYDMCKAVDKSMEIGDIYLEHKSGGKSGEFHNPRCARNRG